MKYSMFLAVDNEVSWIAPTGVKAALVKILPYSPTSGAEFSVKKNAVISLPSTKYASSYRV